MNTLQHNSILQGGKYKIIRHISSGGFGNTYEGVHTMMDTRVAIKEFFPKMFCNRDENTSHVTVATQGNRELVEKLRKKFNEEAKAVFQMKHDNIVRVLDIFEENGTAYYVMEYIDGKSLNDITKERGTLPEAEAVGYIRQVADALKYVHSLNRLHLDIKPGNIMVDKNGKAILIDFGASKHYDDESGENTSTLMGVNTKGYAPVEQSTQSFTKFSPATDIYALGATLYKLLTGITPPDANLLMAKEETLAPLPGIITPSTRNAVSRAMTLIRADRTQDVDTFLSLLDSKQSDNNDSDATMYEEEERIRAEAEARATEEAKRKAREEEERRRREQEAREKSQSIYKKLFIGLTTVVLLVGIIVGIILISNRNNSDTNYSQPQTVAQQQSAAEAQRQAETSYRNDVLKVKGVTYEMVLVEGGTFTMGATSEMEDPYSDEKPTHSVTLSSYYIGKTEVTQALWKAVMGTNPSDFKGDNLPVENVSWNDCKTFISKLNSITGQDFRLPTEAEWEFAARGGNKSRHFQYSGSDRIGDVAWYSSNSGFETHAVATKKPNELGLYDMSGNVLEWCSDWYGDYSSSSQTNPKGPSSGSRRVVRGGSWFDNARRCRSSFRGSDAPAYSYYDLGLRLVLVP